MNLFCIRLSAILLLGSTLAACNTTSESSSSAAALPQQSDAKLFARAKTALAATLKDPDSAKFGDMLRVPSNQGDYVCGRINAKNSLGGYAGAQKFSVAPNGDVAIAGETTALHVWASPCWSAI